MSDIVVNVPLDEGVTINVNANDDLVVNVVDESPVVVNMCDDNGSAITDYSILTGKPKVNGVELIGDKSLDELGIELKKGADDNYVTDDEKSKLDRLLVDFTVPYDTTGLTFDRDKNGVLFSTLDLKNVSVCVNLTTSLNGTDNLALRLNGLTSNYNTPSSAYSASFLIGANKLIFKDLRFVCLDSTVLYYAQGHRALGLNPQSALLLSPDSGILTGASNIASVVISGAFNVLAGSTIKIYPND